MRRDEAEEVAEFKNFLCKLFFFHLSMLLNLYL